MLGRADRARRAHRRARRDAAHERRRRARPRVPHGRAHARGLLPRHAAASSRRSRAASPTRRTPTCSGARRRRPTSTRRAQFAEAIHAQFPGKLLAYNCSPSFNWKKHLDDEHDREVPARARRDGLQVPVHHARRASTRSTHRMFELARGYARRGHDRLRRACRSASSRWRRTATRRRKHQREVGTGYFDQVLEAITGGQASTLALRGLDGGRPVQRSVGRAMPEGTKADELALELEQAIVRGELAPGQVLRQEELSERYGVSRTPVREALRRLAALGLVSFEPNRGVRVRTLVARRAARGVPRARRAGVARDRAGGAADGPEEIAELAAAEERYVEITMRMRDMSPPAGGAGAAHGEWLQRNYAFHDVIYEAADSPLIGRIARSARRTFLGQAVWARAGRRWTSSTSATSPSTRRSWTRSPRGSAHGRASAGARARARLGAPARGDPGPRRRRDRAQRAPARLVAGRAAASRPRVRALGQPRAPRGGLSQAFQTRQAWPECAALDSPRLNGDGPTSGCPRVCVKAGVVGVRVRLGQPPVGKLPPPGTVPGHP